MSPKRVAITGAGSGLGRALALEYARNGWWVALSDVNQKGGQETLEMIGPLEGGSGSFFKGVDVRDNGSLEEWKRDILQRWGGLDVVINNAGVATYGSIDEAALEDWSWVIDINLMGVVRGCHTFVSLFKKQGFGHVVNIASMAGLTLPPNMSSYNVTKAAVVALSETLKTELRPFQIGVSVVCPAFFQSNIPESIRSPNPKVKASIIKLMAKTKLDAAAIARIIYKSVLAKKFYVLPHGDAAFFWFLKRYLPSLFFYYVDRSEKKRLAPFSRKEKETGKRIQA